jgi:hypothetical protein
MGSVNAEPIYTASGFTNQGGVDFNGVYRWADSQPFPGFFATATKAGYYRNGAPPEDLDSANRVYLSPGTTLLLGAADGYDAAWDDLFVSGSSYYFYGYTRTRFATNWTALIYGTGPGTNPAPGVVSNSWAWNFRRGGEWDAGGWVVGDADYALDYRRAVTTGYASVSVSISGTGFDGASTAATVTASASNTPVAYQFAAVTNMIASGALTNGDSITFLCLKFLNVNFILYTTYLLLLGAYKLVIA